MIHVCPNNEGYAQELPLDDIVGTWHIMIIIIIIENLFCVLKLNLGPNYKIRAT